MQNSCGYLRLSFIVAILLITSTHNLVVAQNHDLVFQTCKQTPLFGLCISTLRADPRSKTADTAGLGLVMVDALKAKTKAVLGRIKKLSSGSSNPQMKGPLRNCAEIYNAVLTADVPEAVEALTKGDPKFAEDGVVDAGLEASYCEDGFGGRMKSPLTAMNKGITDLATVSTAIIRMLL